jgi:hypothetical protein
VGPDVNECDALTLVVQEDEQNAVPGVYGKTLNVFQLSVQLMRMKPWIELIAVKDGDLVVCK